MGHRLSKIVTKTGDKGNTGLGDGSTVSKTDSRIEALGTADELNSQLGLLLCEPLPPSIELALQRIQNELFELGSELSVPELICLSAGDTLKLETDIEAMLAELPMLKEFILPGGNRPAALCHVARSVCRRLERVLVEVKKEHELNPESLRYINRLSDWLFVSARILARLDGGKEVMWQRR